MCRMKKSRSVSSHTHCLVRILAMSPSSRRSEPAMTPPTCATTWSRRRSNSSPTCNQQAPTLQTYRESKCRILTQIRYNIQWLPPLNHNKWRRATAWRLIRVWVWTLGNQTPWCRTHSPWFKTNIVSHHFQWVFWVSWRPFRWSPLRARSSEPDYEVCSFQSTFDCSCLIWLFWS